MEISVDRYVNSLFCGILRAEYRRKGIHDDRFDIAEHLGAVKHFRILKEIDEHSRQCFRVEVAQKETEIVTDSDTDFLLAFADQIFRDTDEILIEKAFQLISSDGIVDAVENISVLLDIIDDEVEDILVIDEHIKLADNLERLLFEHPLEQSVDVFKMIKANGLDMDQLQAQVDSLTEIVTLIQGNNGAISGTSQYLDAAGKGASDLETGLKELNTSYKQFDEAINSLADGLSDLAVNVSTLKTGVDQIVDSYETLDTGINDYTDGVASIVVAYQQIADGTGTLVDGSSQLLDGSKTLKDGTSDLYDGALKLDDGIKELSDGTQEFYDQTSDMDEKVQDKIDTMLDSLSGSDDEIVSFISDKNTNVQSVQFVIKTDAIEKAEVEQVTEETTEKQSFWEKLVNLFKF